LHWASLQPHLHETEEGWFPLVEGSDRQQAAIGSLL
jgi:hypothetical protein